MTRIVREEGFLACWRGVSPTIVRACCVNVAMLTTFDNTKKYLREKLPNAKGQTVLLYATALSGLATSFFSLPPDNIKTKLQNMRPDSEGIYPYKGYIDCAFKTLYAEGLVGFWAGFPTYYFRVAPHAMLVLLLATKLR